MSRELMIQTKNKEELPNEISLKTFIEKKKIPHCKRIYYNKIKRHCLALK